MTATGETPHPSSDRTIDPEEIARFAAHAASWWDPAGSFRPLHRLNPARLDFIRGALDAHFACVLRSSPPLRG